MFAWYAMPDSERPGSKREKIMRKSPAYLAVEALNSTAEFKRKYGVLKPISNQTGESYFALPLPVEVRDLKFTFAGTVYRANPDRSRIPHVSVYENFKLNERYGKSVFHLTWYGVTEESSAANSDANDSDANEPKEVVVHVYFSQTGALLYSNVRVHSEIPAAVSSASADAPADIELTPQEAMLLQRHAMQYANPVIIELLNFVYQQAEEARGTVNKGFSELEKIRSPQSGGYIRAAKLCIQMLERFDRWRFEKTDSRLGWLRAVVQTLSGSHQGQSAQMATVGGSALFASGAGKDNADSNDESNEGATAAQPAAVSRPQPKRKAKGKPKRASKAKAKADARRKSKAVVVALKGVNERLAELEADTEVDEVEKTLQKLPLLEERVTILASHGFAGSQQVVQEIFRDLREHHEAIKILFIKKAMLGGLAAVQKLSPYVPDITSDFFETLVRAGHIQVIEFIIDSYPESMIYVNHFTFKDDPTATVSVRETLSSSIMIRLLDRPERLDIFELFLRKGADPNSMCISEVRHAITVLDRAVYRNMIGHARLLLQFGADFYFNISLSAQASLSNMTGKQSTQMVERLRRQSRRGSGRGVDTIEKPPGYLPPFYSAISNDQHDMMALFIEFDVLLSNHKQEGLYAPFAFACCMNDKVLNPETVRILIEAGADINELNSSGVTVLQYQLERNRLEEAEYLLTLGADPNCILRNGLALENVRLPNSVFLQSVVRKNSNFIRLFLENERVPVSVATYIRAFGFYASPDQFDIPLTLPDLLIASDSLDRDEVTQLLFQYYNKFVADADVLQEAVAGALVEAGQYYDAEKYRIALRFYTVGLLFGTPEVHYQACLDIAKCFDALNMEDYAVQLYGLIHLSNAPQAIKEQAEVAIQRLAAAELMMNRV